MLRSRMVAHRLPRGLPLFVASALSVALAAACAARAPRASAAEPAGPYVLVLGTAQDGGLPQIGCDERACREARLDPSRRRLVTSLLLADPRSQKRWLVDATPDLREQFERARPHPPGRAPEGPRPLLFDGVFLTHAHVGHYSGLIHFGREIHAERGLPVYVSERMSAFLSANGPWELLSKAGHVVLLRVDEGVPIPLASDLHVHALRVPHRDEYSDTLAFLLRGPERSLLYVPDIDKWERWELRVEDVLAEVDYALVDGTFFGEGELPGRDMSAIPHPFIEESLARFADLPAPERAKIFFTHLNHTNPAADEDGTAAARVRAAGFAIAREGQVFEL